MNINNIIEIKPAVMLGKPVIKGTRIPVELIMHKLGEGATFGDLLDGYPNLSEEGVHAALIYAADAFSRPLALVFSRSVTPSGKTQTLSALVEDTAMRCPVAPRKKPGQADRWYRGAFVVHNFIM